MREPVYKLASSTWDDAEKNAILRLLDKETFTMGEAVAEFEQRFAAQFGSQYAVMVNSGSSANLLGLAALCYKKDKPLKADDEIIVPAISWSTTFYPVHQYGMKLVFIDVDKDTLNMDINLLEAARSDKTCAVLVPSILGNPAHLEEIKQFCNKYDLYLIEDNCEAMSASLNGKPTGSFGVIGTFSTFFAHHITTMEGGVINTDDEEIYHLLLSLRSHGWTRHLPEKNLLCTKSPDPFEERFRFILPGYNVRPMELMGAVGIEQLKKLPKFIEARIENAAHFKQLFATDPRFIIQKEHGISSWYGFSLLVRPDAGVNRSTVLAALDRAGIETRPVVSGNFLKNDVMQHLNHRVVGATPNADFVHNHGFFVGNHQFNIADKLDLLAATLDVL
jgi:CDP-4-dehydro-6-deoxyglucose reductase, E1